MILKGQLKDCGHISYNLISDLKVTRHKSKIHKLFVKHEVNKDLNALVVILFLCQFLF